jgi:hypothetical protein
MTQDNGNSSGNNKRFELIRNTVVFQLKLMADGFRDLLLLPISLVAALVGLLRGGSEPEREFNRVLDLGRETEHWINLFGRYDEADTKRAVASMDSLFNRVEETLKQQYQSEGTSERVQAQIASVLDAVQRKARNHHRHANDESQPEDPAA